MKYSIIPNPVKYEVREESIVISSHTEILCVSELKSAGDYLSEYLHTIQNASEGRITISFAKSIAPEGYALYTENGEVFIKASTSTGAFHAVITLKWILMQCPKDGNGKKTVTGFLIEDKPCYRHRGVMLDECRHFFGISTVKKLLDNMALLKLNVFHWHLSDDQGFRVESKEYPLLNEIGSKREFAGLKGFGRKNSGSEYGPFYYTQEQIKEIVAYAKKLHINVIPEFDIPGHTTAILASYPEYGCNGEKVEVAVTSGIMKQILCAGNEDTFVFIDKLFGEICPLFESKIFHIGGDEARYANWKNCEKCQSVIKDNGLKNEKQLQIYFMNRVEKILAKYGKRCISWNDCIDDTLDGNIICQYWNPVNCAEIKKQAIKREIILSPMSNLYFDFKFSKTPVKRVFNFNEKRKGFAKPGMKIRGIEAELWTEWIETEKAVEFSFYPRIAALSEVCWCKLESRKYKDFDNRMKFYKLYLKSSKINYSKLKNMHGSALKGLYSFGESGKEFKKNETMK